MRDVTKVMLRDVASRVAVRNSVGNSNVLTISAAHGLVNQEEYFNRRVASADLSQYYLVRNGDFAYNKSYSAGWPAGVVKRLERYDVGIVSPLYICFRADPSLVDPAYLQYYFNSGLLNDEILWVAKEGVRNHGLLNVGVKDFFDLPLLLPPRHEQRRVTEILDEVGVQVQRAISRKRKMALVAAAATAALVRSASEAAGVKWTALEEVADISSGVALGNDESGDGAVSLPYLRVANVQEGYIDTTDVKFVTVRTSDVERLSLAKGDVLLTEGGDLDKLGRGGVWDGRIDPCLHQNHVFKVRCNTAVYRPEFLASYLASPPGKRYFLGVAKQTTNLASINSSQVKKAPVPIVPLAEQERVVTSLAEGKSQLASADREIEKLRLLQSALMNDLLTGKICIPASS
ncbi:hypothetical protein ACH5AG_06640 [Streptomyces anulatus]